MKIIRTLFALILTSSFSFGQTPYYKNLKVYVTDNFDYRTSITVDKLGYDPVLV
jgi:hypothetical protein